MTYCTRLLGCLIASVLFAALPGVARGSPPLVEAVKKADKATVRQLLASGVDVNAPEVDGTTALHWAARTDDVEVAAWLLRAGANASAVTRYGVTPLSLACTNGNVAVVQMLLEAGADPNTTLPEGETALMAAALTGKADAVRVLLAQGADPNRQEEWRGQTALMWAAAEGNVEATQVLLEHGADIDTRSTGGFTPLLFAAREGRVDVARVLLEAGADVNASLPFRNRRRGPGGGRPAGSDAPVTGPNSLMLAVANAHYELASYFLDRGADANTSAQGWTALHLVSWVRKPGHGGNDPAPEGSGTMGSLDFVKKLAAHGADLNVRITRRPNVGTTDLNMIDATPFLMAARTADAELMQLLVDLGADPFLANADNTTPLLVAAGVGTRFPGEDPGSDSEVVEAIKVALALGGDVNAVDNNCETVMHGVAYKLAPSAVHLLVDSGAKMEVWNRENEFGWTPLDIAQGIVQRDNNTRPSSPTMIAALRGVLGDAAEVAATPVVGLVR
jgi:ankyrin repeat protein